MKKDAKGGLFHNNCTVQSIWSNILDMGNLVMTSQVGNVGNTLISCPAHIFGRMLVTCLGEEIGFQDW